MTQLTHGHHVQWGWDIRDIDTKYCHLTWWGLILKSIPMSQPTFGYFQESPAEIKTQLKGDQICNSIAGGRAQYLF